MRDRLIKLSEKAHKEWLQKEYDHETDKDIGEYVADYLLENGVIVLPCKTGDTVYKHWSCGKHGKSVAEFIVDHIDVDYLPDIEFSYSKHNTWTRNYFFSKQTDIGKTVFLTREEAEQALRKDDEGK
jgi:hypothetical protein